ncbi:hypothetical protein ACOMHN_014499 [Nucella lapillus]
MSEERQLVFREESNLEDAENVCRRRCPRILLAFLVLYALLLVLFLTISVLIRKETARPHVILILVDDLGWNDVEWRDADMRTPALRALKEEGVLLNNSYAHPLDSPSRAALFTGKYPFHMGLQHETMDPYTPTYLPENFTLLPSYLRDLGYKTRMVGKWHLGFCNWKYTPASRGFESFSGFYTDRLDYYTHRDDKGYYDFRSGEMIDLHADGTHSTRVLTDRATYLIRNHDRTVPLFMVLAFQAVHSPVQAPEGGSGELYEGGTRVLTLLSGPSLLSSVHGTTHEGLFHQVDWVPTILSIADGSPHVNLDGINQWDAIRTGGPSPRKEIIYNIVDDFNNDAIRVDNFKFIGGAPNYTHRVHAEQDHSVQLYDLSSDPGESKNLADSMPEKVASLQERVKELRKSLVAPMIGKPEPKADPALWNNVWSPGWC